MGDTANSVSVTSRAVPEDVSAWVSGVSGVSFAVKRMLILLERYGIYIDDEEEVKQYPAEDMIEENQVVQCINELCKNDRDILKLHDLFGFTLRQCAVLLGITEDAAKQRHARALKRLAKKCMEEALL